MTIRQQIQQKLKAAQQHHEAYMSCLKEASRLLTDGPGPVLRKAAA